MKPFFDVITRFISSINEPLIISFSRFFDLITIPLFLVFFIFSIIFLKRKKRLNITIISIFLALIIVFSLKFFFMVPRPCSIDETYFKGVCPEAPDFSFPSGHTMFASSLIAPFLGTIYLPFFILFNLIVGFTRINLGVHFLNDVIAGFVISMFSYGLVYNLIKKRKNKPKNPYNFEIKRQALHIFVGLFLIFILFISTQIWLIHGQIYVTLFIFIGLQILLLMINDFLLYKEKSKFNFLFRTFERHKRIPGYGAFWYGLGILFCFIFLTDYKQIIVTIIALGIGDAYSTIIGRFGKIANPFSSNKTVEGSLAFFLTTSLFSFPFIGPVAFLFGLFTAICEALPLKIDDNFVIPLASVVFFLLI
jgi:phytol kinase